MVSIRLSRVGKKNHASFRFIVSDKRKDTIGPALEVLGWYDPHANPTKIEVNADRVQFWMSKGAQPSATVHNLLVGAGILKGDKVVIYKAPQPKADPAPVEKKAEPKAEEKKPEAPAADVKAEAPQAEAKPAEAPKTEEKPAETPAAEVKAEEPKAEEKKVEAKQEDTPAA